MTDFWIDTHLEIKRLLFDGSPKARESEGKINNLICPECGKPEAYAYADEPNVIMCHRFNKCGSKTLTREIFPYLFNTFSERFPATKTNPSATAKAYLESRGLDTSKFEFSQGKKVDGGKEYQTVCMSFDGVTFHRLIDYSGKDKNRLAPYKGKFYATDSVENAEKVFIVEGIFDALVLEQSGFPAIAVLTSMHNPEVCFKKDVHYVLAFDNDRAGIKAIENIKSYLKSNDIDFTVALPPKSKDWNDLLLYGELSDNKKSKTLELCLFRGELATAGSAFDYFKLYVGRYKNTKNLMFEFKDQTYKGFIDKDDNPCVKRILDCVLNIDFSVEDTSLKYESQLAHIVKAISPREKPCTIRLRASDLVKLDAFKSKLSQYRLLFFGGNPELTSLAEFLFNKKPIKIRECMALGYDKDSDCYVFNEFLYDKTGARSQIDKDGYFHKQGLMPFSGSDKSITKIAQVDAKSFVNDLFNAFGDKGLLALGFWVSTAFSHVVFDEFGFFPFLSMHGDPHCGKSDLTMALNRGFFVDSEGLPMTKANTLKGELRVISQKSSMVTALLEGRADDSRFDYESILPLYNRNPLQVRAQITNDNQTHELKFVGALGFVQNKEQFVSKASKERVISIHFSDKNLEDTYGAWKVFKEYSPEQLAGIGDFILSRRSEFEKNIIPEIIEASQHFRGQGVSVDRIAKNHAVAYAGASIFMELAKSETKDNLLEYACDLAKGKAETARSELLIAEHFMDCIEGFSLEQGVGIDKDGYLVISMPRAKKSTGENWANKELFKELKAMDGYVKIAATRTFDDALKCNTKDAWFFRVENDKSSDDVLI